MPNKVFGDIVSAHFGHPEYILLTSNVITELTIEGKDENNILIGNHSLPINAVFKNL